MKRMNFFIRPACVYFFFCLLPFVSFAQRECDFKVDTINKLVKEFPEEYRQSTPMEAYVAINYISAYGKDGLWRPYSTHRFYHLFPKEATPDKEVAEGYRDEILNRIAKECIVYRDSTAVVLSTYKDSMYVMRYLSCENGKWLNAGEDMEESLVKAKEKALEQLSTLISYIPRIERLKQTPSDTVDFVNYLKQYGRAPDLYVLEKLSKYQLVVYGEMHRRKVSWDVLRQVIKHPEFSKSTGTVFFELPSHKQKLLDRFYAAKEPDLALLLDVFGSEQINGWHDKDEFDFMVALKELNAKLPEKQRIKIVLTDFQTQWDSVNTPDEFEKLPKKDRNTHMADVIEQTLKQTTDSRNALFIVGFMHAYKSHVPGMFSTPRGQKPALTVAAQLAERFSDEKVFSIFPHCATISNSGRFGGRIRDGLYDYVFKVNHNIPVAFDLIGSPFGKEPFDGGSEVKYNPDIGNYEENFDGYIFFQQLESEEKGTPLLELFTDAYVEEVKRRAKIVGVKEEQVWFYDVPMKSLTKEIIIKYMEEYAKGKRWNFN